MLWGTHGTASLLGNDRRTAARRPLYSPPAIALSSEKAYRPAVQWTVFRPVGSAHTLRRGTVFLLAFGGGYRRRFRSRSSRFLCACKRQVSIANHGSIRDSWPTAFSSCPRRHTAALKLCLAMAWLIPTEDTHPRTRALSRRASCGKYALQRVTMRSSRL